MSAAYKVKLVIDDERHVVTIIAENAVDAAQRVIGMFVDEVDMQRFRVSARPVNVVGGQSHA